MWNISVNNMDMERKFSGNNTAIYSNKLFYFVFLDKFLLYQEIIGTFYKFLGINLH